MVACRPVSLSACLEVDLDFINIAPAPILARLERADDRMLRLVEVLGGVLVLRGVAAPDVAAGQAQAQVDPGVAHFEAFFTAVGLRFHVVYLIEVSACAGHEFSFASTAAESVIYSPVFQTGMEVNHERHDAQNPVSYFSNGSGRVDLLLFHQQRSSTGNSRLFLGRC